MNVVLQSAEAERHEPLLTELLAHVSAYNPNPDGELIGRAFDYACEYHKGQRRNSGEDFIHHPWSVAVICCDMKLDSSTIAAALLPTACHSVSFLGANSSILVPSIVDPTAL